MSGAPEDHARQMIQQVTGIALEGDLEDTPARMVRALREMTSGYQLDPAQILSRQFDVGCDEIVVVKGVRFTSLCEHHLLPFSGVAHVGYLPGAKVVGLSKLARLVTCFAQRLQVQERLTREIADAMNKHLSPRGVAVVITSRHACMGYRGARQPDAEMSTSSMLGAFRTDAAVRAEFFNLVR